MQAIKLIFKLAGLWALLYFVGIFINAEINFKEWEPISRWILGFVGGVFSFINAAVEIG